MKRTGEFHSAEEFIKNGKSIPPKVMNLKKCVRIKKKNIVVVFPKIIFFSIQ